MAFCSKCGKELKEGENFCPDCGTKVGGSFTENRSEDLNRFMSTEREGYETSPYSRLVAAILACPLTLGLGLLGIHLFYLGNTKRGLTYLLVTILLGWLVIPLFVIFVLALIDFIKILTGDYVDSQGRSVSKW